MKRILSTLLVCALLVGCVMALASCGKMLSGKYQLDAAVAVTTYEFKGNKVTITVDPIIGETTVKEGTYKIAEDNEGNLEFVFTEKDGEPEAVAFSEGEEDGVKYIKLGILKYTKVD